MLHAHLHCGPDGGQQHPDEERSGHVPIPAENRGGGGGGGDGEDLSYTPTSLNPSKDSHTSFYENNKTSMN